MSVAYKNAVGKGRTAWRAVVAQMTKDQEQYGQVPKCIHDYKNQIEVELKKMCEEILGLIKQNADGSILYDTNPEAIVFYIKMQGDYWRYISEFSTDDTRAYSAAEAYQSYYKALEKAKEGLSAIHPIRLGLALNFSVFYFEVYGKQQEACALAKEALDAAEAEGLRGGDAETHLVLSCLPSTLQGQATLKASQCLAHAKRMSSWQNWQSRRSASRI